MLQLARRAHACGLSSHVSSILPAARYVTTTTTSDPARDASTVPFYELTAKDIKGQAFPFSRLQNKVVLIVNTAATLEGLQKMYEKHKDKGFEILAFPTGQFSGQAEPASEEQIECHCRDKYGVTFPLMSKVDVNGGNAHEVYQCCLGSHAGGDGLLAECMWLKNFLKSERKLMKHQMFMEMVKDDFEKFLVHKTGEVMQRFGSAADPMREVEPEVAKLLESKDTA